MSADDGAIEMSIAMSEKGLLSTSEVPLTRNDGVDQVQESSDLSLFPFICSGLI